MAGKLDILKWIREDDYRFTGDVCTAAAKGGHLEVLKWLPWSEITPSRAAEGGHIENLKIQSIKAAMNAKNLLQEYYQRQGLPSPKYISVQDDNTKMWSSTVITAGFTYKGASHTKKVAAEIAAAEAALLDIVPGPGPVKATQSASASASASATVLNKFDTWELMLPIDSDQTPLFILIDYENVNKLDHLHNRYVNSKGYPAYVCKFVGFCNQKADTVECTHVVQSSASDAVDHYISFYLGMLYRALTDRLIEPVHDVNPVFIILTRDKFGSHLQSFIKYPVHHCPSEVACIKLITGLGYTKTDTQYHYY